MIYLIHSKRDNQILAQSSYATKKEAKSELKRLNSDQEKWNKSELKRFIINKLDIDYFKPITFELLTLTKKQQNDNRTKKART